MKNTAEKKSSVTPIKTLKFLFKKPITFKFPFETREASPRYRGFHLNDWEKCTGCGNCADICPNSAITMIEIPEIVPEPGKKNERPQIDYGRCCFCALCVDICPPGSLRLSRDYIHIDHATDSFVYLPKDEKADTEHFVKPEDYSIFQASLNHRKQYFEGFVSDLNFTLFDPEREPVEILPASERVRSFIEEMKGYTEEQAKKEALRCLECSLCEEVCPAHMKISDYIKAIYNENLTESVRKIYEDNPLPGVCGRVCTHKCETACSIGYRGEPVAIRWLKRYAVDNLETGKIKEVISIFKGPELKRKVSIIGSGPSGLSAAYYLSLMGYQVVIYEAKAKPGGIMRYGIPKYRLPESALDRDIDIIKSMGVEIKLNTKVGKDIEFEKIKEESDAVFIATGFPEPRSTGIKGIDSEGCYQALNLLEKIACGEKIKVGEKVVIIGGGNVAFDIGRSLARLQMKKFGKVKITLTCLEKEGEMLADREEIEEGSEEGLVIKPGRSPKEVLFDENGRIRGLRTVKCLSIFDEEGRFNPKVDETDVEDYEGNMIVEAIGQAPDYSYLDKEILDDLEIVRGRIVTDEYGRTKIPWLFAGGDIVHGPDIIHAIADGHRAAQGIDLYLGSKSEKVN